MCLGDWQTDERRLNVPTDLVPITFAMLLILSKAHSKHWRPTTRLLKDTRAHKSRILSILRPSKNYTTPKRSFCWLTFITFFSVFYSFLPHYPAVILAKQNLKNLQRNYFTHTTRIILKKFYFQQFFQYRINAKSIKLLVNFITRF